MSLEGPSIEASPRQSKQKKKILNIQIIFDNETDCRNSIKYFVDSVEGGVKYLTQDVSVGNKLLEGARLNWQVSDRYYPEDDLF